MRARRALAFAALAALVPAASAAPARALAATNQVQALWVAWTDGAAGAAVMQRAAADACAARGFTAVRFAASPYWPADWSLLTQNSTDFWARATAGMDALVAGGCTALVPSLFWNIFSLPDLHGEPLGALARGARGGASAAFDAQLRYIDDFVGRFRDYPIAAWELNNEMNLIVDIDQSETCNSCSVPRGTPAARSRADNISTADAAAIHGAWAQRVRAADGRGRPVSSGNAIARPAAEHLRASYLLPARDWTPDSFAQFSRNLADAHACCEWVSQHVYPGPDNARWGVVGPEDGTIVHYLQAAVAAAGAGKRLFIGEFGQLSAANASGAAPRPFVDAVLAALNTPAPPGVPGITTAALAWTWEFGDMNATWALWPGATQGVIDSLQAFNAAG
jgi:hypothetical protein